MVYIAQINPPVKDNILQDPRIQKAIRRLQSMGIAVYAYLADDGRKGVILIDEDTIIRYMIKRISEATLYPHKRITYDRDNRVIRMEVWKPENRQ
ncbi:MAG: hypothetical protein QXH51_07460 [Candidatus Bathyarchaeia archaeon]